VKVGDLVRLNDKNKFGINYSNDGICVLGIVTKKVGRVRSFTPKDRRSFIKVHWFARVLNTRVFNHEDYFDANDFEVINERG
jgi:hypothetical protein